MHRDNLEKFVLNNRDSFDREIPSLEVWAEIDKGLHRQQPKRLPLWRGLRVAAAVLLLLVTGAAAGHYLSATAAKDAALAIEEIAPDYVEMAQYYEQQIDNKVQQLASYQQGENVLEDFKQLDKQMEELKEELLRAPRGREEQIVENLIRSYQTKVQILERVLERIEATSQENTNTADDEVSI